MRNLCLVVILSAILSDPAIGDTNVAFTLQSGVEVTIVEAPFQKGQFNVEGCSGKSVVCRINGHVPFGVAFSLPKTYVKSITISFHEKSYALDVSDMYNAWGNRPLEYPGKVRYFGGKCFDEKNCQIRGLFSDAAGTFVGEWRVVNGLAVRTVLTDSNDVVNLFTKYIDPPEFD